MMKMNKLLLLLCTIITFQGCSSSMVLIGGNDSNMKCDMWVYGGTKHNTNIITDKNRLLRGTGLKYFLIIDYPFSLIADTVALPYTFYKADKCKVSTPKKEMITVAEPTLNSHQVPLCTPEALCEN